jgi:hypothetical protein
MDADSTDARLFSKEEDLRHVLLLQLAITALDESHWKVVC